MDGRRPNAFAHFFKGLLRGARMRPFTRGPVTVSLTTLTERPRELTPEEREVVDDLVVPQNVTPGERLVTWTCAACGNSGVFVEGRES
jgi:hypothetical protein